MLVTGTRGYLGQWVQVLRLLSLVPVLLNAPMNEISQFPLGSQAVWLSFILVCLLPCCCVGFAQRFLMHRWKILSHFSSLSGEKNEKSNHFTSVANTIYLNSCQHKPVLLIVKMLRSICVVKHLYAITAGKFWLCSDSHYVILS